MAASVTRAADFYTSFLFFRTTRKLDDKGKHVRCVIPTKDNPPPEMNSWLLQFQVFTRQFECHVEVTMYKTSVDVQNTYIVTFGEFFFLSERGNDSCCRGGQTRKEC